MSPVARQAFFSGARSMSPILLGVVPFALIAGVSAMSVGLDALAGAGFSVILFSGAAQLAAMDLIGKGFPLTIVVLTALIINLRFVMYSASLADHFRDQPRWWKGLLAYLLTDQSFAISISRFQGETDPEAKRWYYLGGALALWSTWQVGTWVGILLGARLPSSWALDFTIPLTFLSLLFPVIRDRPAALAALAAGLAAVLFARLPHNLGLVTASVVGIAVGLLAERKPS